VTVSSSGVDSKEVWLVPARVNPRMEMPSIQVPVRGVLGDDIDRQLSAVWQILNRPGFEPPEPNPIRVLRRSGTVTSIERAVFVTDVLNKNKDYKTIKHFPKRFLLALRVKKSNRDW